MCQSSDKQAYLLASKLYGHQKKVQQALDILRTALEHAERPSLSFSSGKDSVVLLDLAVRAGFQGDLVFFKYGILTDVETPLENIELLKYYSELHGLNYQILDCLGEVDCWEMCDRFTLFPETDVERRAFNETNMDFKQKYAKYEKRNGVDLSIIGMRKDESRRRKIVLNSKGSIYETKERKSLTCCPIANFTNRDIWSYIFSHDLPYLSVYDYPNLSREEIRNEITLLYNDAIIRHGMIFHYRQMYQDFFLWLTKRWGDVL